MEACENRFLTRPTLFLQFKLEPDPMKGHTTLTDG